MRETREIDIDKIWAILKAQHHCPKCECLTITHCDRSKQSELVEYMGQDHKKTKPQRMWMYPSTGRICPICGALFSLDGVKQKKVRKSVSSLSRESRKVITNKVQRAISNLARVN